MLIPSQEETSPSGPVPPMIVSAATYEGITSGNAATIIQVRRRGMWVRDEIQAVEVPMPRAVAVTAAVRRRVEKNNSTSLENGSSRPLPSKVTCHSRLSGGIRVGARAMAAAVHQPRAGLRRLR